MVSLFLTTKTPEKQHIRPRSTIHHTHHIITAWEPGSCVSPLGLEMESAENRGFSGFVNITILQFWFGLFFNFLLLSLHFFFFCFYAERELIFDLNTCFARLNCFKVDKIKKGLVSRKRSTLNVWNWSLKIRLSFVLCRGNDPKWHFAY